MAVDPRNFLLNTDYPLDKVVYLLSGSYTQAGGGGTGTQVQIAHNLPFRPLVTGSWSTSSDFSVTHEMFMPIYNDIGNTYVQVYSNDTNITISGFKNSSGNQTIYYRIYGLAPNDSTGDAPSTASNADNFVLNTDYNYCKLYYNDTIPASAATTITHNFGYRPQIMAWAKDMTAYGTGVINTDDPTTYITVTTSTVVTHAAAKDIHLRIYADSQT